MSEMAELTGVGRPTLSRLENGVMLPRDADIEAMEAHYGPIADWYPPMVLLALEFDDDSEHDLRKRLWEKAAPVRMWHGSSGGLV
jgi:transcriptional regulator with XRE-family HTH domain